MSGIRWLHLWAMGFIIMALFLATASLALAQGGFTVTPVYIDEDVSPGPNSFTITVRNDGDETQHFEIIVAGYGQDLSGLGIPLDPEEDLSPYTGRELISVSPSELDVPPGEPLTVSATITIPDDADGGRYALILVRTGGDGEGGVVVYSQIAVSLRLTIAGSTLIKTGEITGVETTQEYAQEPITFLTTFKNTGNVHFSPEGEVIIRTEDGNVFDTQPIIADYVIPGYSRQLRAVWQPEELPVGNYTAEFIITLEDGTTLSQQDTFYVDAPYWVRGAEPPRTEPWTTRLANFLKANWYWIAASVVLAAAFAEWGLSKVRAPLERKVTVSPRHIEHAVSAGDNTLPKIKVSNNSRKSIRFQVNVIGYAQKLDGSASPGEEGASPYPARISIDPSDFSIQRRKSQEISIRAWIPQSANGGLYALISLRAVRRRRGKTTAIFQTVVPLRLTIEGSTLAKTGEITEVRATQKRARKPVTFLTTFKNTGNVHFSPTGEVIIRTEAGDEFGRQTILAKHVIPGYSRNLRAVWQPEELPVGDYSVESTITLEDGSTVTASGDFRVLKPRRIEGARPWWWRRPWGQAK